MKKVVLLIDDYSATGGMQRVMPIIANGLSEVTDIKTLSFYHEFGSGNDALYKEGMIPDVLYEGKKEYVKQAFRIVKRLRVYLKKNDIDVLIANSEMLAPYCILATLSLKTRYICWSHSTAFRYNEALLQRPFKWLAVHFSDAFVVLTETIRSGIVEKYKTRNTVVIPNPIDRLLLGEIRYDDSSKKIITVGRFCYEKYYEKLLEVADIVLKKYPDWTWDIYGDGDSRKEIQGTAEKMGLKNLIFKGNTNHLYDYYGDYSFLVMTSRSEAYPMALLEGMAKGLPLVAFNIPSVNEIIKDGSNGYCIEAFDEKRMAERMEEIINKKELRKTISSYNEKDRENYSLEKAVEKWMKLIENN